MSRVPIQQAIAQAVRLQQSGRLREAETIYQQILAGDPNHADALHFLGVAKLQAGQYDAALDLISKAVRLAPNASHYQANLAQVLTSLGRLDEAIATYEKALKLHPNFPEVYSNMGNALLQKGEMEKAERSFRKALELRPSMPEALNNLGTVLLARNQLDQAIASFQRAIAIQADFPQAHVNLAKALHRRGNLQEAVAAFRSALAMNPADYASHNDLGNVLHDLGRHDEAVNAYRQALYMRPNSAAAHSNLSAGLLRQGKFDESLASARQAIVLDANLPDAQNNAGTALMRLGNFDGALDAFTQAVRLRNEFPLAHLNRGLILLLKGDYARGWDEYAWRLKVPGAFKFHNVATRPQWTGEDLTGKTIFLHAEQGFGDSIMFARYVPMVAQRGANVIVGCQPELQQLFQNLQGVSRCVTPDDPLPPFDVQCALTSLPMVFQTRVETIPLKVPYLSADANSSFSIPHSSFKNIGLVWSGRAGPRDDQARALSLDALAPLAQVPNVHFHSLQKGDASAAAKNPPAGMRLTDWNSRLQDFADSAALIQNLDLLITVDTAAAHLAGALGKPAFVLLPFVPDWRWMENRDVSPWYPTLRLFRQPSRGDWAQPIAQVIEALRVVTSSKP